MPVPSKRPRASAETQPGQLAPGPKKPRAASSKGNARREKGRAQGDKKKKVVPAFTNKQHLQDALRRALFNFAKRRVALQLARTIRLPATDERDFLAWFAQLRPAPQAVAIKRHESSSGYICVEVVLHDNKQIEELCAFHKFSSISHNSRSLTHLTHPLVTTLALARSPTRS